MVSCEAMRDDAAGFNGVGGFPVTGSREAIGAQPPGLCPHVPRNISLHVAHLGRRAAGDFDGQVVAPARGLGDDI